MADAMSTNILIPQTDYETIIKKVSLLEKEIEKLKVQHRIVPERDRYLDIRNASQLLGISRASFYRIIKRGELGYTTIGRQRRILFSELLKYTEKKRKKALNSII